MAENLNRPLTTAEPTSTSVDANWSCTANVPGVAGVASGPLEKPITVGEKFVLVCEGDSANLKEDQLRLELPKEQKYALKILGTQSIEANKGIFTVTSYRVGQDPLSGVVLTDGTLRVALNNITFAVQSVIDPQENPENKPYAPPTPLGLAWPSWLWISIALILAAVALAIVSSLQKAAQRRRLRHELTIHGSALSPYQQLNKEFRSISRTYPLSAKSGWTPEIADKFIVELEKSFRWFLTREFIIPAHEWRVTPIAKAIRKKDRALSRQIDKDLRLALRELVKGRAASAKLTVLDAQQLVDLCRRVADRIHNLRKDKKSA